jgi:hypothetical protein
MSALTLLILIAFAGWLGWRLYANERDKLEKRLREKERRQGARREVERGRPPKVTQLERDPKTGVYRPSDDGD